MTTAYQSAGKIDTSEAHPARRYNYWLGGKDHFAADRESGDRIEAAYPGIRDAARANRGFLQRAVRYLAQEAGIRQFLDIGTGLPAADNTHEVAQHIAPDSRIVYVDNDPLVLTHARALLTSNDHGKAAYIEADLHEPEAILAHPDLSAILDLSQPVALLLVAVLHFVPDGEKANAVVATMLRGLPAGSYLVLSHASYDQLPTETVDKLSSSAISGKGGFTQRTKAEIGRYFEGLDLIAPGLQTVSDWRPDSACSRSAAPIAVYGAVARKPVSPAETC
jgi:S-adenosyl methyltransferase